MVWECLRYFHYGWIQRAFIAPKFLFTYPGFDWVTPWSGDGIYYHFLGLGVLAFFMLAGFLYRISATLFFLAFSYVFLLSESRYLNHFYLVVLISFIMIFVPAHPDSCVRGAHPLSSHERDDLRNRDLSVVLDRHDVALLRAGLAAPRLPIPPRGASARGPDGSILRASAAGLGIRHRLGDAASHDPASPALLRRQPELDGRGPPIFLATEAPVETFGLEIRPRRPGKESGGREENLLRALRLHRAAGDSTELPVGRRRDHRSSLELLERHKGTHRRGPSP